MAKKVSHNWLMAKPKHALDQNLVMNFGTLLGFRGFRSQMDLVRACGVPQTTVSRLARGDANAQIETVKRVADALRCDVEVLYASTDKVQDLIAKTAPGQWLTLSTAPSFSYVDRGIVEWNDPDDLPDDTTAWVPRITVELHAGNGRVMDKEDAAPPLPFQAGWLRKKKAKRENLRVVDVRGDSMEPYLRDGDIVLVDLSKRELIDGHVYALRYGDDLRVKYLFRRFDGGLTIRSENRSQYPDENITPDEMRFIEVLGEIIWRGG
jgi:phage repressor protein C with HTH and peptisase S24 domain/DNA-binding XRE family transcriptional regulator